MSKLIKRFFGRQSFVAGALIISAGGFISKILGALYRIPLTNILGGEGMGIYQMVYPLYCILLTVSASGIPAGIARLISSGRAPGAEKSAFKLYGFIGVLGTIAMFLLAKPLASAQGEPAVGLCCKLLAPAVFFVAVLSVVRGYFQGRHNMIPTAFTEVCEQLLKVLAGVAFAWQFRGNMPLAVASTLFAVTLSEGFSALFAVMLYRGEGARRPLFSERSAGYGAILRYTVPITFTAIAMPVSQLAESIVAVNLLRSAGLEATALYGIFSGCAVTTAEQNALLVRLVRIMSINAVTLSVTQTASACLTALGTPVRATAVQWVTCALRVGLAALFIVRGFSVEGVAIASNIAYFVAAAVNLWYIIKVKANSNALKSKRRSV